MVRAEPLRPPNFSRYVTRPDLTPVGVSVSATPRLLALGRKPGYIFCAPKNPLAANPGHEVQHPFPPGATPGLMVLETSGDLVWFKPLPGADEVPFNFRVQTYNGKPTLTWFQGSVIDAHGVGHYVLADDTYQQVGQVVSTGYPCDLHEFIITPEGTALHTAYDDTSLRHEGVPVFIGHAQEVDVATNELVFDWASYPEVGARPVVRPGRPRLLRLFPHQFDRPVAWAGTRPAHLVEEHLSRVPGGPANQACRLAARRQTERLLHGPG